MVAGDFLKKRHGASCGGVEVVEAMGQDAFRDSEEDCRRRRQRLETRS